MNKKDYYYFGLAEKVADISDYPRIHIGAIIVHKNKVIGVGRNQLKTHKLQDKYNPERGFTLKNSFLHAEISAIVSTHKEDLSKCSIYVFRKDKNNKLAMSKPCPACMKAIRDYGIRDIFYTTDNGFMHEIIDV